MATDTEGAPPKAPGDTRGTMKAIVRYRYGSPDVLELRDIEKPEVADEEVLVRVQAAGVETIEPVLSIHTPGVPEVRMTRETPARAECDRLHVSPSGITFSRKVKLQPEACDSHGVCGGAFVYSIDAFGVGRVRLVVRGV